MEIKSDIINCAFKARAERAQQHRSGERGFAFKPIRRTNLIKTSLPFKKLANTFPTIIVIAVNYLIEKFPRLSREEKKKREDDAFDCTLSSDEELDNGKRKLDSLDMIRWMKVEKFSMSLE